MLNNGVPPIDRVPHPVDATRWLFVSFDYCHILKNWRNQWLDRISIFNGVEITAAPLRKLLDIQHKNLFQLAYKLTNKHLYPNNLERQKVQPAVDIFQPDITVSPRCVDMKLPGLDNIGETGRFSQLAWFNVLTYLFLKRSRRRFLNVPKVSFRQEDHFIHWFSIQEEIVQFRDI